MIKLTPSSVVAVVGASNDPEKYGYKIVEKLLAHNIKVWPVNLHESQILGQKAYAQLSELPQQPDIINFVVSPSVTVKILDQVKDLGWNNVWFQPGSFDDEVIAKAKELGFNYVDDACIMVAAAKS